MTRETAVPDDLLVDPEYVPGDASLGEQAIMQHLQERVPDCFTQSGIPAFHSVDAVYQAADTAAMSARYTIVTRSKEPNRHGNMVQITEGPNGKGLLLDNYQRAPIVFFGHGFQLPFPVGLSVNKQGQLTVKLQKTKATAECFFSSANPASEDIFAMTQAGLLPAASIAYRTLKAMRIKPAEQSQAQSPDGVMSFVWCGLDMTESELLEWSILPIGADQGSFKQALDRGSIDGHRLHSITRPILQYLAGPKTAWAPGWGIGTVQAAPAGTSNPAAGDGGTGSLDRASADPASLEPKLTGLPFELAKVAQSVGVMLRGEQAAVEAFIRGCAPLGVLRPPQETAAPAAAVLQTSVDRSAAPVTNAGTSVLTPGPTAEQLAQALRDAVGQEHQALSGILADVVKQALAPVAKQTQQLAAAVQQASGRVA